VEPYTVCEEHGHTYRHETDPPDVIYDACVDCGEPRDTSWPRYDVEN